MDEIENMIVQYKIHLKEYYPSHIGLTVKTKMAAELLGITEGTLRNWRSQGIGPKYIKHGGCSSHVQYSLESLARFQIEAQKDNFE